MKLLNRLVNIVILLLAIATFVMSFLLYQKREQLVKGWEKMSDAVSKTSATLDKGSNTGTSKKLTLDALNHTKYSDLDSLLPTFNKQASSIIDQRNNLSTAIVKAASTLDLPKVPKAAALDEVKTSSDEAGSFVSEVDTFNRINDRVLGTVCTIGNKVSVNVNVKGLKGSSASSNIQRVSNGVNALKSKSDTLSGKFRDVARIVGSSDSDFGDSGYKKSVNTTYNKVREMKRNYDTCRRDLGNTKSQLANARKEIDDNKKALKKNERKIASLQRKIERLEVQLGKQESTGPAMQPSDPKLLAMLRGKIIDINSKWGMVVLSIGKNTKIDNNTVTVPINQDMNVVRGLSTKNPEYIGKIRIVQVNNNCSIANIVPSDNSKDVKIGDVVYFTQATIKQIQRSVGAAK